TTVTGFTVNPGGTLLVDNTTTNANNRLGSGTALNLAGGTFTLVGSNTASTNTTEQLGAVNVQSGFSTFNMNQGTGGNLTLVAASLNQTGVGAAVNFAATGGTLGTTADNVTFTTAPTLTNNIVPYATAGGADFAVYNQNSQTGLSAPTGTFYATTLAGATASSNVKLTNASDVVAAAGQTVNSLIISGNGQTIAGLGTLTTSALLVTGGSDAINAPVNIGTARTVIANAGAVATFNGPISGTALSVAGAGTTLLNNANTYTGGTTLESGTLTIGNPTGLGTGALTLLNGTVQASLPTTVSNDVNLT